ncbi:pyridoxal phosphate-dependent aminotransferase [Roseococcus pinisoli]|uniref:pyridoxal phosphate-dependent aminotransferase n=1 Tax=Roseococcus pinisoli TaxID=2835040 RepID=UPI0020BEF7C9|nr:pyridoxal phosphate-dependent aminotransferase [Roseococcus pinisoli]
MGIETLAPRLAGIGTSPAAVLRRRARELRAAGRDVIELSSGDLDFPTPPHVIEAAHRAAQEGATRYTNVDGTPELKDAVREKFLRRNGLDYGRDEVIVSTGSTQAIFNAFFATLAPGDEVIVPVPCWAPYLDQVRLAEGVPVPLACPQNNGFKLRPADLRAAIGSRTRWLILNSPVNPTGAVYGRDELAAIAEVLLEHPDIGVVADSLYEDMVFDGRAVPTLAEVEPRLRDRVLTTGGVAKSYAMMGWRVGYAGGPAPLIAALSRIQSQTTGGASSVSQAAALAALTGPQELLAERASILARRRDAFAAALNACEGLACPVPEGSFYLFIDCAGVIGKRTPQGARIETDRDFAAYLLDTVDVVVVAGQDFGLSPYIRASFANPDALLEEAGQRIRRACAALR